VSQTVPAQVDALVIGAGQAGLAVAHFLERRGYTPGHDLLVIDGGTRPGGAWQYRWDALKLGRTHRLADLPDAAEAGLNFAAADNNRPSREVVAEYFGAYEQHFGLGVVRPAWAEAVHDTSQSLTTTIRLGDGTRHNIASRVVVSATGTWHTPRVPDLPGRDTFRGPQVSTNEYTGAQQFAGMRVAVVGGGTSALGFMDELHGVAESTIWFTRRPPVFAEGGELAEEFGRRSVALQDEAARAGRRLPSIVSTTDLPRNALVRALERKDLLHRRPMFTAVTPTGVLEADGSATSVDAIIWATGFDPDTRHLRPLGIVSDEGAVAVAEGQSVADPRVFLAGYGPQASTISAHRGARRIARTIADARDGITR